MHRARPHFRRLLAAALLFAARPLAAQDGDCTTRVPACENDPPVAVITPSGGTWSGAVLDVSVAFADDVGLDSTRWRVVHNGVDVSARFTLYTTVAYGMVRSAEARGTVALAPGANTVEAYVHDVKGTEGSGTATYGFEPPPVPVPYATPRVRTAPHHPAHRDASRGESVVAFSTPAYTSLDQPRGVALFYSAGQADPRAFVQVDATDHSTAPPDRMSVRVRSTAGAWMDLGAGATERFYRSGAGTTRLAAAFADAWPRSGAYDYDVFVTSWWPDGTSRAAPAARVRVLVVDERTSPFGQGWSLAGVPRAYPDGDRGVLVTEGDGSAWWFEKQGGYYATPEGDFTTLTLEGGMYHRRDRDSTDFVFHPDGRPSHVRDRFGNQTTFEYWSDGRLRAVTDPAGKQILVGWGSVSHVSSFTDPGGRVTYLGIDTPTGRLLAVRDPTYAVALSVSYDGRGRARAVTDRNGTRSFAYDAWGKLAADTLPTLDADGIQQRPVVGYGSLEAAVLPPAGTGTAAAPAPRVVPDSVRERVVDPRGHATRVASDRLGLPVRVEDPLGRATVIDRDGRGLPVRVVEPDGAATHYEYDEEGSLTGVITPESSTTWDIGLYALPRRASSGSLDVEYDYHPGGLLRFARVGSDTTFYTWDARGRPRTVTDPAKRVVVTDYDSTGFQNTRAVTGPDAAGGTSTVRFGYDRYGRGVRTFLPTGDSLSVSYDSLNRVRATVDAAGDSVRNTWAGDRLYQVRDAAGKTWTFHTNALGWLNAEADPQGRLRYWVYDRAGNVIGHKNHRGQTMGYAYDAVNRRIFTDAEVDAYYAYDPAGRWTAGWNAESTDTLFYDAHGRVERQVTVMGGRRYELRSTWRPEGVRGTLDVVSPWTRQIVWGYTARLNLQSLRDIGGATTLLTHHDAAGRAGRATYPGAAMTQSFTYGPTGAPDAATWTPSSASELGRSYDFDALGRLSVRHGGGWSRGFGYDAAGRLGRHADWTASLQQVCSGPDRTGCVSELVVDTTDVRSYAYDRVGNRADAGASLEPATNRYLAFKGWSLQHDLDGNLTRKSTAAGFYEYRWSDEGRLTGANLNGMGWMTYGYNAFGQRVRRTSPVGAVQRYLYDGDDLLMELDASGEPVREYTFYPGVDLPHSVRQNGQTYYYALEYPGHVVGLATAAGQVVNRYEYTPFGEIRSMTEGVPNPLRFMARELDPDAGLYYVRNRWYDPVLERFVSEDPIGLAGGINPYAYAGNSPTNFRDPSGLLPMCPGTLEGLVRWWFGECEIPVVRGVTATARGTKRETGDAQEGHRAMFGNPTAGRPAGGGGGFTFIGLSEDDKQEIRWLLAKTDRCMGDGYEAIEAALGRPDVKAVDRFADGLAMVLVLSGANTFRSGLRPMVRRTARGRRAQNAGQNVATAGGLLASFAFWGEAVGVPLICAVYPDKKWE